MQPKRRTIGHFHGEQQLEHHMADNDDGEIGRGVVGAMVMQRLAAIWALVGDLQIAAEQSSLAAGRAAKQRAAEDRVNNGAGPWPTPRRGRNVPPVIGGVGCMHPYRI